MTGSTKPTEEAGPKPGCQAQGIDRIQDTLPPLHHPHLQVMQPEGSPTTRTQTGADTKGWQWVISSLES